MVTDQKAKEELWEERSWGRQSSRDGRGAEAGGGKGGRWREGTWSFRTRETKAKGWWRGTEGRCLALSLPAEHSSSSYSQNLLGGLPCTKPCVHGLRYAICTSITVLRTDIITVMRTMAMMTVTMMVTRMEPKAQKS